MTPGTFIEQLLAEGESKRAEFKSSVEPMDLIGRDVCAFLNTDGGFIVAGVDPDGTPNGTVTEEQSQALQRSLRKEISPGVLTDVSFEHTARGDVVLVSVPTGPDRPYVFQGA